MYLHLGYATVVPYHKILGIFDLDNATQSPRTRFFLEQAERQGRLVTLGERIPVCCVVCDDTVYLSPISAQTLCRRAGENILENS